MPGKKTNSTFKAMSPAKRKAAAEASLLRKIKVEDEIKTLQEDLRLTELRKRSVAKEGEELSTRKKNITNILEANESNRKSINKLTGVNKFAMLRNRNEIIATVKEVDDTCTFLHQLNEQIDTRTEKTNEGRAKFSEAYIHNMAEFEKMKDLMNLHLYYPGGERKQMTEQFQERKVNLTRDIMKLQDSFTRALQLNKEKENGSPQQREGTLESFMDGKLGALKSEIKDVNGQIKSVNDELAEITSLVDLRKQEVAEIKENIKNLPEKDATQSKNYRKVLKQNEKLRKKLDKYLSRQDKIANDTSKVLDQINAEKRRKQQASTKEIELQKELSNAKLALLERTELDSKSDQILIALQQEETSRGQYLRKMADMSTRMKLECDKEKAKLKNLKNSMESVGNQNKQLLATIGNITKQAMHCVPIQCRT